MDVYCYDIETHLHEVVYKRMKPFFNLIEDISVGDLKIIN